MPSIPPRPLYLVGPIVPLDQQQREGNFSEGRTSRKLFSPASDASDTESEASDTSTTCTSSLGSKSPRNLSLLKAATNSTCISDTSSHLPEVEQPEERTCQESRTTPQEEQQEQEQVASPENDVSRSSSNDNDVDTDASERSAAPTKTTKKKSVGFEPMSTLYVFEDDESGTNEKGYYDVAKAWYSTYELKAFRAEAFLTVNWMVMKGIGGPEGNQKNRGQSSSPKRINKYKNFNQHYKNRNNKNYTYYSDKYGYDRQKEINAIAKNADYEFCERGVECRTPIGRFVKNKRRLDAMRVVLLYQQMQKQHRRERRREERRQQQRQYHDDEESFRNSPVRRRSSLDPEAARQIQAENEAEALANVYLANCKESLSDALARGQADATAIGMKPHPANCTSKTKKASSQESSLMDKPYDLSRRQPLTSYLSQNHNNNKSIVECPSPCDEGVEEEDDQFMDNLVSISFVHSQDDSDVDDIDDNSSIVDDEYENDDDDDDSSSISSTSCASPPADDDSLNSDASLSLEAVLKSHIHSFHDEHEVLKIEVELVEGSADCDHELSHRIHCSEHERSTTILTTVGKHVRSKSWSHPNLGACASLPLTVASDLVEYSSATAANVTPTHNSFSSLELGNLFFGAVGGMEWW